ncbi:MAG: DJ-1/PfpI family protein [Nitrospirae bacterium]|nr:DJ-1/PfpI family protein [Nitrospirota bacterium]
MSDAPGTCVVGLVVFHGVEEFDLAAPYGVFSALRRLQLDSRDVDLPETSVLAVTRTPGIVHGANGLRILPDYDFAMCPPLDVLIVPGSGEIGEPTVPEMEEGGLWDFVYERAPLARYVAAIGTGTFVLAKAGILAGKRATTHWKYRSRLGRFEGVTASDEALVEDGVVGTAASGAWGAPLALMAITRLWGDSVARRVGRELELDVVPALRVP